MHSAVCADPTGGVLEVSAAGDQFGGEVGLLPSPTRKKYESRFRVVSHVARVPCAPLGVLMDRAGLRNADFLSLDVEGAEVKVLQTALVGY